MKFIRNITKAFLLLCFLLPLEVNGQNALQQENIFGDLSGRFVPHNRKLSVRKSGPYIGIQQGKYLLPEFGYEMQWKRIRLRKPITHAGHMGFNYNFQRNVLGYDAGYWVKIGRMDLTYGGNLLFRTDFDKNAFGFAPVIGFKFWQLHLQTGYHFLTSPARDMETNTFFVSLRYVFINNRDWKLKRQKKKDRD